MLFTLLLRGISLSLSHLLRKFRNGLHLPPRDSAARVHHAFHLEKQVCIIPIFQIGNFFCAIHVVADEYWVLAWPQLRPYLQLRVLLCEAREARLCKELTNAPATTAVRTIPERECFELPNATRTHAIPGSSVLLRRALSTTTLRHLRH